MNYCSFAYSALACFRMGMSGSAHFTSRISTTSLFAIPRVMTSCLPSRDAPAELLDNAVMRDGLADQRVGIRHGAVILGCGT